MTNEDKILELLSSQQKTLETLVDKVDNLTQRVDNLESNIMQIREDTAITREATNSILEWVGDASGVVEIRFPVKK